MTPLVSPAGPQQGEISLFALGGVLLRWRRRIVVLGLSGAALGLAFGLLSDRVYKSSATFVPQGSQMGAESGLALAANQFGIRLPSSGGGWDPALYVKILQSYALLEPIALDTVVVTEEGGRRVALTDLLKVEAPTPALRAYRAVKALGDVVSVDEDKDLGAVKLSVSTRWPSVSLALAQRLLKGVNEFNLETRKSQAAAERQFAGVQAADAERALRDAEDRLRGFLERNRSIMGSPDLRLAQDRLQRDVTMRQELYTSLARDLEEAKIREVRDTPVITVLETPRLAVLREARGTVRKGVLGGLAGGILAAFIALISQAVAAMRRVPSEEARGFFRLLEEAKPGFIRRRQK